MRNGNGKRDQRIRDLRERGLSLRAIGRMVGLSRMQVHRILAATAPVEEFLHPLPVALDDDEGEPDDPRFSHWTVADQARAYRAKLRGETDPDMRALLIYRLGFVTPPEAPAPR